MTKMKVSWGAGLVACGVLLTPQVSVSTLITASENAGLNGVGTEDESTGTLTLRNRFGYAGQISEKYAYLRFAMDAANDTVGGIAVDDIASVTLDLYFTGYNFTEGDVYALDDLANPGAGFLTETTWSATGANELSGPIAPHGNLDVRLSTLVTKIGDYNTSSLSGIGLFQLTLDLAEFKSVITGSSNDEFTLIVDGPTNGNNIIASIENATLAAPALTIVAIPEPTTFGLVVMAGLGLMLRRRRLSL